MDKNDTVGFRLLIVSNYLKNIYLKGTFHKIHISCEVQHAVPFINKHILLLWKSNYELYGSTKLLMNSEVIVLSIFF
jgi:hypothetical protein